MSGSPPRLELGQPIAADLKADASHHYRVELVAGEFTHIVVEQESADVLLTIRDPDGERLMVDVDESANPHRENLYLIPKRSGIHELHALAVGLAPDAPHREGRYSVEVEAQRVPTAHDRLLERAGWYQANALEEGYVNRDRDAAIHYLEKSVDLWIKAGHFRMAASDLIERQGHFRQKGLYVEALADLDRAEQFIRADKDPEMLARFHSTKGVVYRALGRYQDAFEEYSTALSLGSTSRDSRFFEADTRLNLCMLLLKLGQLYRAKAECRAAITIYNELGNTRRLARTIGILAGVLRKNGEIEEALGLYDDALSRVAFGSSSASALHTNRGRTLVQLGRIDEALEAFRAASANYEKTGQVFFQVYTLSYLSNLLIDLGRLKEAERYVSEANKLAASIISKPAKLRALTTSAALDVERKEYESAYKKSELAWTILEELRSDPDDLENRSGLLESEWSASDLRVSVRMLRFAASKDRKWLRQALEAAEQARARGLIDRVDTLGDTSKPYVLNAEEMQLELDEATIQLQFHLGSKKSYLWRISRDSVESFDLPNEKVISQLAHDFFQSITARDYWIEGESAQSRGHRILESDRQVQGHGSRLYKALKLSEALEGLRQERILFIADGILHRLPFAALPLPNGENSVGYLPLVSRYEIISVPSSSALAALRNSGRKLAPTKEVLAFADPVFNISDPRLSNTQPAHSESDLPRLPATEREVADILDLASQESDAYTGFEATKSRFEADIRDYRYLHFATHGIFDDNEPTQTALVLSRFQRDGSRIPGLITIKDVSRLELSADLAVLSACKTARGREVRGEGVVGLSRSFMMAGVPRVVSSLWTVQDGLTHSLMTDFYRRIWRHGAKPAEALRESQLELWKQDLQPYYWAPFVIQGEWR